MVILKCMMSYLPGKQKHKEFICLQIGTNVVIEANIIK